MADNEVTVKIKLRHDTEANWKTKNPVLLPGELAISSDKAMFKAGNGTKSWSQLSYNKAETLHNLTATIPELNYVHGVTSSLQSQLNGKAPVSHTHNYAGASSPGGSAASASKLSTPRTIALKGAVTGSAAFDGSANISLNVTANPVQTVSAITADTVSCGSLTIGGVPLEDYITNLVFPEETGNITPSSGGIFFAETTILKKRNKTVQLIAGLIANTAVTGTFPIISTWATIQSGFRPTAPIQINTELLYGDMNAMIGSASCVAEINTSGNISIVSHGSISSSAGISIYVYAFQINCSYTAA